MTNPNPPVSIDFMTEADLERHRNLLDMKKIGLHAALLDDLEQVRKANGSRYGALTGYTVDGREWVPDKDGQKRTGNMERDDPHALTFVKVYEDISYVEQGSVKALEKAVRSHPIGGWIKDQKGLGAKQVGRLLAAIGDPYWRPRLEYRNEGEDKITVKDPDGTTREVAPGELIRVVPEGPRTVSALWAYAGLHVVPYVPLPSTEDDEATAPAVSSVKATIGPPVRSQRAEGGDPDHGVSEDHGRTVGVAARRRKGVRSNWSTEAKTRAYLCAASCLKQLARTCEAGAIHDPGEPTHGQWLAVHNADCKCSPYRVRYDTRRMHTSRNRPDWTDGHRHNDALRVSSKEILKMLWVEARRLHCLADPELAKALGVTEIEAPQPK